MADFDPELIRRNNEYVLRHAEKYGYDAILMLKLPLSEEDTKVTYTEGPLTWERLEKYLKGVTR